MFIDFKERRQGRKRERERDQCEKHQFVASWMHPDQGLNPEPRYVP